MQQAVPEEEEKGKHRSDSPQLFINKVRKHQNPFPNSPASCMLQENSKRIEDVLYKNASPYHIGQKDDKLLVVIFSELYT